MRIHFIGIGGIGISALMQYYLKTGHKVSGSDLASSEITDLLKKKEKVQDILYSAGLVGIRYPDHETTIKLIELAGVPITSTSANISGEAPPVKVDEIKISADYIIDGGECNGEPSTVVDVVNRRIVRKGADYEKVVAALLDL